MDSVTVRHFQVHTRLHGFRQVRAGAPVGNDHPVKAPFLPENFREQVAVFTGIIPVQAVVGRHHRGGTRRFYHVFKGAEIDFPQGALVNLAVGRLPVCFLVVGREMLEGNRHVFALRGTDIGRAQPSGQEGVFAEILKIPAAQGGTLHVDARPQQHGNVRVPCFLRNRPAQPLRRGHVPRTGQRAGRGVAGGHQTDVVLALLFLLLAQAVRPVGQMDGGQALHLLRVPHAASRQKFDFLVDIALFHESPSLFLSYSCFIVVSEVRQCVDDRQHLPA